MRVQCDYYFLFLYSMAFYHNNYYILSIIYFHSRKYHLLFIKIIAMSTTITIFRVRNIFTKTSITADYCYVKLLSIKYIHKHLLLLLLVTAMLK